MASLESLVDKHQRAMQALADRAEREIAQLWLQHGTADVTSVDFSMFVARARGVIGAGRVTAAEAAQVYYAAVRELAGEVGPYEFVSRAFMSPAEQRFLTARLAEDGPLAAAKALQKGQSTEDALARSMRGVKDLSGQYVSFASRASVIETAARDSYTVEQRYFRIAHAGCCAICAIAASRGAVYHTDKAKFHRTCRCEVCPAFRNQRGPVGIGAKAAKMFDDSNGTFKDFEDSWLAAEQPNRR